MMKPEHRLPWGCWASPLALVSATRICTIAGRAVSAKRTKARLRRSSSESPSACGASRHMNDDSFLVSCAQGAAAETASRRKLNRISLVGAIFSRLRDVIGFFLYLKVIARTRTGTVNNFRIELIPGRYVMV